MATLEEQIRELEARRAKGEVVPQLDALYKKQDDLTRKGYESVVNPKSAPKPVSKRAGGKVSSASKRADGCAIRGKTRA